MKILKNPTEETLSIQYKGEEYTIKDILYVPKQISEEAAQYWVKHIHEFLVLEDTEEPKEEEEEAKEVTRSDPPTETTTQEDVDVKVEDEVNITNSEDVEAQDLETLPYQGLKKLAKELGINSFGKSQVVLVELVKEKLLTDK